MATRHTPAVIAFGLVAVVISTAPAAGDLNTGGDAIRLLAGSFVTNDEYPLGDPQLADYPGGAGGTSNGLLSAAQRGEPVGADGTSGGSLCPFALATST